MPEEWVYPVNDTSPNWGYEVTALQFFAGARDPGLHCWNLPRRLHQFRVGDYIWVRAAEPVGGFVGLGQVASDLRPEDGHFVFDVAWDTATCQRLAAHPVPGVLQTRVRQTRRLTPAELGALRAAAGGLPLSPPVPLGKVKRTREVTERQGQSAFRDQLLSAYGRCAVTGTNVHSVLQAAHIEPYNGPATSTVANGLLLRADIHNLFDTGHLWVTASLRVALHPELRAGEYGSLHGRKLRLPKNPAQHPAAHHLAWHRTQIAGQPA